MIHPSLTNLLCDVNFPSAIPTFDVLLTSTRYRRADEQTLTTSQEEPGNQGVAGEMKDDREAQGKRL